MALAAQRILYLATDFASFASHKMEIARAAVAAGYDVIIAAHGTRPVEGMRTIELNWKRAPTPLRAALQIVSEFFRVRRAIAGVHPDILHNIDLKPALVGSLAAIGQRVSIVNSINGFGFIFFSRDLIARLVRAGIAWGLRYVALQKGARVVVQNADDAAFVRDQIRVPPSQIIVIRGSGVDPANFTVHRELPSGPFRFLILSRLLYLKGIQVAVAAIRLLRSRGVEAELAIAGAPDTGNPSSITEAEIAGWSKQPGITFLGQLEDVRPALAAAHIVVQPSLGGEGLPRSLLEAAAAGRGMIASDVPGIREVVIAGETGLLVRANDAAALADAMAYAIGHPSECVQWGQNARAKLEREFAAGLIQSQHVALYHAIAGLAP